MENKPPYLTLKQVILLTFLFIIMSFLSGLLPVFIYGWISNHDLYQISRSLHTPLYYSLKLAGYCGAMLIVVFITLRKTSTRPVTNIKAEFRHINIYVIATCILITYSLAYFLYPFRVLFPMPEDSNIDINAFSLLGATIAAPVLEELLFRGIFLKGLLEKYSPAVAIVSTSLLFAILHLYPWHVINTFLDGLLFGWLYYKTRSVIMCMLLHAAHNLGGWFFSFEAVYKKPHEVFAFILISLILALGIWLLNKLFNKYYPDKRINILMSNDSGSGEIA